jgi:hypothetical protein
LNDETPTFLATGQRPDISVFLIFMFYEPVYFKAYENTFPSESWECRGKFVGISEKVGHAMCFLVLSDETQTVLHRSEVRTALDPAERNLRVDPDFATEENEDFIKVLSEKLQSVSQDFEEPAEKLGTTKSEKGEPPETTTPVGEPVEKPPWKRAAAGKPYKKASTTPTVETVVEEPPETPPANDEKPSSTATGSKPQFNANDLRGRTFLMDATEDGNRHRARIVETITEHDQKVINGEAHAKFKLSVNDEHSTTKSWILLRSWITLIVKKTTLRPPGTLRRLATNKAH